MDERPYRGRKARMFAALRHFDVGPDQSLPMNGVPKGIGWSTLDALEEAGMLVRVSSTTIARETEFRTTDIGRDALAKGDEKALPRANRGIVIDVPDEIAAQWIAAGFAELAEGTALTGAGGLKAKSQSGTKIANDDGSSKRIRASALSYPPRGLGRIEAARYIGISTTKFDEMVADGRMPRPKAIDARRIWDRHLLDEFFEALPDVPDISSESYEEWEARRAARNETKGAFATGIARDVRWLDR